ncbi:MAG: hypothetical protein C4K47_09435 [Candidatus Thorarchaeota archaeon]|nr:MAG: hypothetical protein C4K47_09435 [Candidatus Thorarchaeota archaeon]
MDVNTEWIVAIARTQTMMPMAPAAIEMKRSSWYPIRKRTTMQYSTYAPAAGHDDESRTM